MESCARQKSYLLEDFTGSNLRQPPSNARVPMIRSFHDQYSGRNNLARRGKPKSGSNPWSQCEPIALGLIGKGLGGRWYHS